MPKNTKKIKIKLESTDYAWVLRIVDIALSKGKNDKDLPDKFLIGKKALKKLEPVFVSEKQKLNPDLWFPYEGVLTKDEVMALCDTLGGFSQACLQLNEHTTNEEERLNHEETAHDVLEIIKKILEQSKFQGINLLDDLYDNVTTIY